MKTGTKALAGALALLATGAAIAINATQRLEEDPTGILQVDPDTIPLVGTWIAGSLVDLRVVHGERTNATTDAWTWTIQARWHNGTTPTRAGIEFPMGGGFPIPWGEGEVEVVTRESKVFRPHPPEWPIRGRVERIVNGTGAHPVDVGVFAWRYEAP